MAKSLTYINFEEVQNLYPKIVDNNSLENNQYNELTILYRTTASKSRNIRYVCKCSCGKYCIVSKTNLLKNLTKSCGHLRGKEIEDLKNQKFGKLTPIYPKRQNNRIYWFCNCDCGGNIIVKASHLKENLIQSCGCIKSIGEEKISNILKNNNITFIKQYNDLNCVFPTGRNAIFDFYIPTQDSFYLIEYDGIQHFKSKDENGWNNKNNLIKTQNRDNFKNQWCKENNIPLIRIPYTHLDNLCLEDLLLETSQFII